MRPRASARCFVAVRPDEAAVRRLAELIDRLSRLAVPVRWVAPANVHLTLAFLGEVDREQLAEVGAALAGVRSEPFSLALAGVGRFPPRGAPRVVWAGLEGQLDVLHSLQQRVQQVLEPVGFAPESRPFRPHLTLGRCKERRGLEPLLAELSAVELRGEPFMVTEFALHESRLEPAGARHATLQRHVLRV